jgi:hypothetical protein
MTGPTPAGPTSIGQVAAMLSLSVEDPELPGVVAAVNSLVGGWLRPAPDGEWAAHHRYGASLLAARYYRRTDAPLGFLPGGMDGATYVTKHDPDIAQLLGLGVFAPPRVG